MFFCTLYVVIGLLCFCQHFPMYRESDKDCIGEDTAPASEKNVKFKEAFDCLSKQSSELLFKLIKPRLILSGHTHHHCITKHVLEDKSVVEYSVPSFSWRNRNDPSFYLVSNLDVFSCSTNEYYCHCAFYWFARL